MNQYGKPAAVRANRMWREIADRVFVRRYSDYNVTIGLVVGDRDSLVVDTRGSERQGRELMEEIRWLTSTRMRVVNTHHHYDHAFGNFAFVPSEIWGHERCATRLREDSRTAQFALAAAMPEVAAEYVETRITPPDKTFRESVELELGGRQVTLAHLGRGHTDNDVVVVVPDVHVVFAGDLIEQGGPPSFEDSYPMDWPGTLERVLEVAQGPVVPGHGEVVGRSFVEGQLADLSALAQLARRVRFDGGSVTDAMPLSPFPSRAARQALVRAFAQLAGEL
ncbi:MAG: MBL fold metallo-hydrolase [Candidatus Limnocylindrales bacterium]|jgi:glyoxylase-like metal-dependent hydrolase (beta-lactamase superfamily II)